jgi:WD40 repeat protein
LKLQGIEKIKKNDMFTGLAHLASAVHNHPDQQHTSTAARIVNPFIQRSFALPLNEPLQHRNSVYSAIFNPDGNKILTSSFDKTACVWPIAPPFSIPVPEWLAPLAEVVAENRINDQSVLEPVEPAQILHFREQFRNSKDKDPYSEIARWFFADKAMRPASPYNMDANTK